MRLLLDTHIIIWALGADPRVKHIAERLTDPDNEVYFSVASLWEMAIKVGTGKLEVDVAEFRAEALATGFMELPVLGRHIEALAGLPNHHRDPFDRLLVVQAASEPMRLITVDATVAMYGNHIELI
ncbi:MAG: type II toxin-antitoxin system VapC family toxin [Pelomonas sp.]|nr:type II toxin-antitoxin system VapC family toxin [Roseateles sp.]